MFSVVKKVEGSFRRQFHSSSVMQVRRIYDNILDAIGETPLVRLNNIAPEGVNVYAKCEFFNPLSSVKDRLALAVIENAIAKGELKPGQTVVEATSGNTGIALAMVCAQKGIPLVITMAEPFSIERRKVMRMLGAKVIITPAAEKGTGMVKKAQELAKTHGWYQTRQFENNANIEFHAKTTGPEIISAFPTQKLDYWVTGYGTGGTVHGAGRTIKAASPETKIILSEPAGAPLLGSGLPQERQPDHSSAKTHPAFNPHPIQGWTPDFIPWIVEQMPKGLVDEIIPVDPKEGMATSHLLARKEGIFTGISGGSTCAIALQIAKKSPKGTNIVFMLPDTAERYLSTPLFESIAADMSPEELEISKSSPNFQLHP